MRRPETLWDQYHAKAQSELLRGSGQWPLQPHPVDLEPPWDPFYRDGLTVWDCMLHGWERPYEHSWLWRTFCSWGPILPHGHPVHLRPQPAAWERLVPVVIEQFPADEGTVPKAEQILTALPPLHRPLSFELWGVGARPQFDPDQAQALLRSGGRLADAINGWSEPYSQIAFVADKDDAVALQRLLLAYYPNSAVTVGAELDLDFDPGLAFQSDRGFGTTFGLAAPYCLPLKTFTRLDPDPLGVALAALDHLGPEEWAAVQVLFTPASRPWHRTLEEALANPYRPGTTLLELDGKQLKDKFGSALFAVSVRVAAKGQDAFAQLAGWAEQFAQPPEQALALNQEAWAEGIMPDREREALASALTLRCAHRPGMLLNARELAGLVHLPGASVAAMRLRRLKSRTRPAVAATAGGGSVLLGDNVHQGQKCLARIPAELRGRHCYLAGASGTGKSTLLLNMIVQDVRAGAGVGLLDPHGDLVKAVLKRVPMSRIDDVILFDPADTEHPFALNILEAKDEAERERIAAETVLALERYFPSSWGPRLERILMYTVKTALHAIPGATLGDVERMLTEADFRQEVIARTTDPRYLSFWQQQFVHMPKNAVDPVLNKLSVFLLSGTVRNIIGQRQAAVDFDGLLNEGKILLANLSTGLLTEKIAGMFGSFLVTKIVTAAFRRAGLAEERRRPWYLYVDEFQSFMNLSVGFDRILTEARKYNLVLAGLANQYVGQLTPQVRQAIFGNVGTFVVFRLGVDDANLVVKELGAFTAEEILNLERGQAIARTGGSATAFNLTTYPPLPVEEQDATAAIVRRCREQYTRPRAEVEQEVGAPAPGAERPPEDGPEENPADPPDDDLVQ